MPKNGDVWDRLRSYLRLVPIAEFKDCFLSLFRGKTQEEWDLKEFHDVFVEILAESIAESEVDESDFDSIVQEALPGAIEEAATTLLTELKRTWPKQLRYETKQESGFRKRTYARWKGGIDLLRMILLISLEVGGKFNEITRPSAEEKRDHKFEALVNLHARALRVSHEVLALLQAGFPDGALSRWRTLHEIAVIMTFLRQCEPEVSERFLLHRRVMACKAMKQYREFQDRANLDPISDEEFDEAVLAKEEVINRYGPEMNRDYGWAAEQLRKKNPSLFDLEVHVGLDHWRPRYRWACDDIHGSYRTIGSTLGEAEAKAPFLLAGASNSAFTDPAHMMAISLNLANAALLLEQPSIDLLAIMRILERLTNEVGEIFIDIEARTSRQ